MEQDKLYRETELTLQQLSDKLQLPTYQVSQAINEGMKRNFYDLVNSYRVEEAKRLLKDRKSMNYTILSVGFDAGFNSKTTFNTVFKKFTGYTPTAFRNREWGRRYAGIRIQTWHCAALGRKPSTRNHEMLHPSCFLILTIAAAKAQDTGKINSLKRAIKVESNEGAGAEFTLILPVNERWAD